MVALDSRSVYVSSDCFSVSQLSRVQQIKHNEHVTDFIQGKNDM